MKVEAFLLCDAATEAGSKLNILGAFDSINAKVPAIHSYFNVAARIRFEKSKQGNHIFELNLTDPHGKSQPRLRANGEIQTDLKTNSAVVNVILKFIGFPLNVYGEYKFDLFIDGTLVATHPLFVFEKTT